jgi:phospholipid/cholesterol/gamma-HCH transport system substrate-binding protein
MRIRNLWRATAAGSLITVLSGCGASLAQLPGPSPVSGPTYHLTLNLADALNLTVGAKVKRAGIVIGQVSSIGTSNYQAHVGVDIRRSAPLPAGTTFQVRFSTPLGDDFIAANPPALPGAAAALASGAVVSQANTGDAPTIEDTFASLSLLLNGGGINQIHTIVREMDTALTGQSPQLRDLLTQLDDSVTVLDSHRDDIDRTLSALRSMGATLSAGTPVIDQALQIFPGLFQQLSAEVGPLNDLLARVSALGQTVTGLVSQSQSAMVADFDELRPTLDQLTATESDLIPTFQALTRFGTLVNRATPGDYVNVSATVYLMNSANPDTPGHSGQKNSGASNGRRTGTGGRWLPPVPGPGSGIPGPGSGGGPAPHLPAPGPGGALGALQGGDLP